MTLFNMDSGRVRKMKEGGYKLSTESCIQCILLLGLLWAKCVNGYSGGAPEGEDAMCVSGTMIPDPASHGPSSQTTTSPYQLKIDKPSIKPGEEVEMSLSGKDPTTDLIRGYMILVQKQGDDKVNHGKWTDGGGDGKAQEKQCAKSPGVSGPYATHSGGEDKKNVKVKWTAPTETGKFDVFFTVVKEKATFWSKIKAGEIEVMSTTATTPSETTPGSATKGSSSTTAKSESNTESAANCPLIPTMLIGLLAVIIVHPMWILRPLGGF